MDGRNRNTVSVKVKDAFWRRYFELVQDVTIPFQWEIMNDEAKITIESERDDPGIPTEKSHVLKNFRIAAGLENGHHYGWLFQDSDLYKWIEAASVSVIDKPNSELISKLEQSVALIEAAQDEDGYLSTYYQIEEPRIKFRSLYQSHELYCAGHLIEAAIAHYHASGSKRLLAVADRFINCIARSFGPNPEQINGADGHQEIELALVKMYELTGDMKYLKLSSFFLNVRGQDPDFYHKQWMSNQEDGLEDGLEPHIDLKYLQAHRPVLEQEEAVGHAVRMVYMGQAMVGVAQHSKNKPLLEAAKKIWNNIIDKRSYITGGIGSTVRGEAFTFDYDLPTDTMYCETCASIGLVNFTQALQKVENNVRHVDVMERILYNGMISGMSLDGKHYFYVNPLEVDPESSYRNPDKSHVKATRPSWFGCACCPPNLARTIPAIGQYIYNCTNDSRVHVNLWIDSDLEREGDRISQRHDWDKLTSSFTIQNPNHEVAIRIPYWLNDICITIDGAKVATNDIQNSYFVIPKSTENVVVTICYSMPVITWQSHPKVKSTLGKVAFQRGPFVYAAEEVDNGPNLHLHKLNGEPASESIHIREIGDVDIVKIPTKKQVLNQYSLYQTYIQPTYEDSSLTLIPYYSWANRESGEMRVWIDI